MKKLFKYIGAISLMAFSFYYTSKVALFINKEDVIMKKIEEYATIHNSACTEGYITSEGVVLGVSGLEVDKNLSYSEMKVTGYKEELIEFKESPCVVSKENNIDDYIIKGNPSKESISLILNIKNGKSLERIIGICENKRVNISLLLDYNYYENNKEYLNELIDSGYDILYKGNNEQEIKTMKNEIKEMYCVSEDTDNLNECSKNNINTIKTDKSFDNNYLTKVKENTKKGNFIILSESNNLVSEIGVIINYIKSRGLKVITISNHL